MSRGPQTFKQGDLIKALKAAKSAGMNVKRFEVDKQGKIIVITDAGSSPITPDNEWDTVR